MFFGPKDRYPIARYVVPGWVFTESQPEGPTGRDEFCYGPLGLVVRRCMGRVTQHRFGLSGTAALRRRIEAGYVFRTDQRRAQREFWNYACPFSCRVTEATDRNLHRFENPCTLLT